MSRGRYRSELGTNFDRARLPVTRHRDTLSRRFLMKAGIALAVPALAGCSPRPRMGLGATDGALEAEWLWDRLQWMNNLGPRLTGNPAHLAFVSFIADELRALGLEVREDIRQFTRWEATRSALIVSDYDGSDVALPIASEYPYSALTVGEGVSAPLVYGGAVGAESSNIDYRGAIVYFDCPVAPLEFGAMYADVRPYGSLDVFPQRVAHAAGQVVSAPDLDAYAKRGALAVILGWTNVSEAQAEGQYLPFNRPPQAIPALWVGAGVAGKLRELGSRRSTARLVLEGVSTPLAKSPSLHAFVPGATDELVIVTTHTDGPNVVEENGPLAMLAIARRLLQTPVSSRQRSVLFLFPSGHFIGPADRSTEHFLEAYPQLRERAVAGLAVEHLGCMEWRDGANGDYGPTGEAEISLVFAHGPGMSDIAWTAAQQSHDRRGAVLRPKNLPYFFGEGRALAKAGIPTIGFLPAPSYLLSTGRMGHIEKIDRELFASQVSLCARILKNLVSADTATLSRQN